MRNESNGQGIKDSTSHVKFHILLVSLFLFTFFAPYLYLGQDSYITIWDNLDGNVSTHRVLAKIDQSPELYDPETVSQIMTDIPRNLFISSLFVVHVLFSYLESFNAYIINFIIIHLIAFLGMFLLIRDYILKRKNEIIISIFIAGSFMFLPFHSIFGLSIAGLPLLICAFINIRTKQHRWLSYSYIIIFPFYSYLALIGIFILGLLMVYLIYQTIANKGINYHLLIGVSLITISYAYAEHELINSIFFEGIISQRSSLIRPGTDLVSCLQASWTYYLHDQNHSKSYHLLILALSVSILIVCAIKKIRVKQILLLFAMVTLISFLRNIIDWELFDGLKKFLYSLRSFNLGRFSWFNTVLWYLLFASCLLFMLRYKFGKMAVYSLLTLQLAIIVYSNKEYRQNLFKISHNDHLESLIKFNRPQFTYREFYSEALFTQIKNYIGRPIQDYRVLSVGLYPSIPLYNGFYTVDGYLSIYPLAHKIRFREVIQNELRKSERYQKFFDDWGSQCYAFVSEFDHIDYPYFIDKNQNKILNNLELQGDKLKELGGQYVFSTVNILNYHKSGLKYLDTFEDIHSPLKIYIYEVL